MIVCICHRVSDRDIARTAQNCASFDELQFELRVATSCGKCHDCARDTFHRHAVPIVPEQAAMGCVARPGQCPSMTMASQHSHHTALPAAA